jgi:plasmid stabilization system protein ParE
MRRRTIRYSATAIDDLRRIAALLSRVASVDVSRRFIVRIRQRIRTLEYGAERGTIRNAQRGIRMIGILPTVSVAFLVTEDAVAINRILYNGENWTPGD